MNNALTLSKLLKPPLMPAALACALLLAACDGGNAEAPPGKSIASPAGAYSGYLTSNGLNRTYELDGLIAGSGDGHFRIRETGEQITIRLNVPQDGDGRDVPGTMVMYQPGDPVFAGTRRTAATLTAQVHTRDSLSGSFVLGYDAQTFERLSKLRLLAGVWGANSQDERYTVSLTARDDGSYFGSDSKGCTFSGAFQLLDFRFNAYGVSSAVQCGATQYSARGLALLRPRQGSTLGSGTPEKIVFAIAGGQRAYFAELSKQS